MGREHVKLFKDNKWDKWYDSLSPSTQEYLKNAQIWTDKDVAKFVSIALVVGFFFGYIAR
jgi:hypothetical protein